MESVPGILQLAAGRLGFEYQIGGVTTVKPGYSTGWRTLGYLITAVTTYEYVVHRRGLPATQLRAGEALCLLPNTPHCIETNGRQGGISRWSHVHFELLDGVDLFQWWTLPLVLAPGSAEPLAAINSGLAECARTESHTLAALARRQRLGFELLELLAGQAQPRPEARDWWTESPVWAEMLATIGRNPAAPLDVPALARMTHLSVSWFHRRFRQRMGLSPSHCLRQVRLRRAQQLLLADSSPIKQVAARCGYDDPFTFSRAFKKSCGCSPAEFRAQANQRPL